MGGTFAFGGARALAFAFAFAFALAGCGGTLSPLADEASPPPNARFVARRITVPLAPSRVRLEARVKTVTTHTFTIPVLRGTWSAPRGRLDQSLLDLELDMGAARSQPQKIAQIAISPSFLDAARFPHARVRARALRPRSEPARTSYDLFFDLVLKQRRQHLRAPATIHRVGCEVHFDTTFSIDRRQFGIASAASHDSLVGNHVEVRIHATAPVRPFGVACASPRAG